MNPPVIEIPARIFAWPYGGSRRHFGVSASLAKRAADFCVDFDFWKTKIRVMVFFELVRSPRSLPGGRGLWRPVSIASFKNADSGLLKTIVSC